MMQRDPAEPLWRVWRRRLFGAALAAALIIGLFLSFRPTTFGPDDEVAGDPEATEEPRDDRGKGRGNGNGGGGSGGEEDPTEEATEGLTQEEADALIAEARDPEETTVQILDAGGGSSATSSVQEALGELGYDVVAVNASRIDYPVTTVLYTEGSDAEAEALRARDERFADIAKNDRLSEGVDLHVVVAADWTD